MRRWRVEWVAVPPIDRVGVALMFTVAALWFGITALALTGRLA